MASVGTFNYRRPMEEVAEMVSSLPRAEGEAPLSLAVLQDDAASPGDRMQVLKALRDSGAFFAPHEKTVRSLREHPLTLAQGGAQLVSAPSAVDFSSAEFRTTADFVEKTEKPSHLTYYEEVEKIARDLLGEDVVHAWCTSHIIRDSQGNGAVDNAQAGEKAGPIRVVHNDFTEEYGDVTYQRLSDHPSQNAVNQRAQLKVMKGLEFSAEELEQYRMVVLNTWRPITTDPLRREPLAVCDNRTIQKSDLMNVRTGIGQNEQDPDDDFALEVFMSMPNPEHQWHYVDEFTHDECMVFKTYDSDMFPFVPTMHSAFDLPEQEDQPERESVEARVICLLKRTPEELAAFEARKQQQAAAASPLDVIRQHPKFEELKSQIQASPDKAPQIVMGLALSEPELAKAIMENREEFKAMMMEGSAKI